MADEIGAGRTGLRISPGDSLNGIAETDTGIVYPALIRALAPLRLASLPVVHGGDEEIVRGVRREWPTALIINRPRAALAARVRDIESGLADVITVGAMALANPDLVERLRSGAALNTPDRRTCYGGAEAGYTDYPTLAHRPRAAGQEVAGG